LAAVFKFKLIRTPLTRSFRAMASVGVEFNVNGAGLFDQITGGANHYIIKPTSSHELDLNTVSRTINALNVKLFTLEVLAL